jgi:cbb3-type cytochrome oxidase subunit 3
MFDKFLMVMLTIISIFTFLITGKLYYDGNVLKIFDFSIIEIKMLYLSIFGILFICFCFYAENKRNKSYNDYMNRKRNNQENKNVN